MRPGMLIPQDDGYWEVWFECEGQPEERIWHPHSEEKKAELVKRRLATEQIYKKREEREN
jgi:hypothetical protein